MISLTFNYEERPDLFSDYRPGFEIRTTRRCTSIEIRTHADRERLVRTYRLIYLDQRSLPIEQLPLNAASLLSQVLLEGHDGDSLESMPPLEFGAMRACSIQAELAKSWVTNLRRCNGYLVREFASSLIGWHIRSQ